MFFIYILYSPSSNLFYVGYTRDFEVRLSQHNNSAQNTFTANHRPWELRAVFECGEDEAKAVRIEKFIKKQKSRRLLLKMIGNDKLTGELAQLVRVPHVRD